MTILVSVSASDLYFSLPSYQGCLIFLGISIIKSATKLEALEHSLLSNV